jgi:hypothetical protein
LRPLGISIEPDKTDALLAEAHTPVILKFDTEMEKNGTEGIMQISSDLGVVKGDKFWNGNSLYFVPVAGWTAGIRYTLSLAGTIRAVDGREMRIERFVSFYAINKEEPPLLEWYCPADGASTGTGGVFLEFHFSQPMNRFSAETALVFDGNSGKTFEWSNDNKILKVIPDKALSPWTSYTWSLKDSAKSSAGVPLPKTYSSQFYTDFDQTLPRVEKVFPVLNSNGLWFPSAPDLKTGLKAEHGIAIEFNKVMDENVLRSVRFEPSVTGRTEYLSEKSIVYIFTKIPEPQTAYTLIVSGDAKDCEGLKTGSDYKIYFSTDIPFLNISSFTADGGSAEENFPLTNGSLPVKVDAATGDLFFNIEFSLPFSAEEKQNTAMKIILSPSFPRILAPVALNYVAWIGDDRLRMRWEGLAAGNGEERHFYKLTIPGGKGGINCGGGIYMKEDFTIFLEAVNE